jgi:hypothetical protein
MAQLVSINVCCSVFQHAMPPSAHAPTESHKNHPFCPGQDSDATFKSNAVSPFVSVARFKDALHPARMD